MIVKTDRSAAFPYEAMSVIGPYADGKHARLFLGDGPEVLRALEIPAGSALAMDPPYEFDASGGGMLRKNRKYMDEIEETGLAEGFDMSIFDIKKFSSAVCFCHDDQLVGLLSKLEAHFDRRALLVWRKSNPMPVANKHYRPSLEIFIHAWNKGAHPIGTLQELLRDWSGPVSKTEIDHPTVKPLPLMRKIVKNLNSDHIFDPYMGSGTTGAAAIIHGRNFVGVEKNEKHFRTAVARLQELCSWQKPATKFCAPIADDAASAGVQSGLDLGGSDDD